MLTALYLGFHSLVCQRPNVLRPNGRAPKRPAPCYCGPRLQMYILVRPAVSKRLDSTAVQVYFKFNLARKLEFFAHSTHVPQYQINSEVTVVRRCSFIYNKICTV